MSKSFSLVNQLRSKDQAAKKHFYLEYFDLFVNIPLRYGSSKNEAISIVNDGFLKIFATINKLKDDTKLIQWSKAIVRNTTIDHVRRKVSYNKNLVHLDNDNVVIIENSTALQSLQIEEIMKIIQTLVDTERIVFCMYAIDGFKHAEIANKLQISIGTSKWYLNKARTNLKILLKQYIS